MDDLTFGSRLWLALTLPFKVLFDASLATRLAEQKTTPALQSPPIESESAPVSGIEAERDDTAALHLLSILQREGRFIDFLQEDLQNANDAEIGAVARVVQDGCKRALNQYVKLSAIRGEAEGTKLTLEPGYDAQETRITGKVTGAPPHHGTLAHHGWRVDRIDLPQRSPEHDAHILAPAEVEI